MVVSCVVAFGVSPENTVLSGCTASADLVEPSVLWQSADVFLLLFHTCTRSVNLPSVISLLMVMKFGVSCPLWKKSSVLGMQFTNTGTSA